MVDLSDCLFLWITEDVSLQRICYLQEVPLLWMCGIFHFYIVKKELQTVNGLEKVIFFDAHYKSKNI